MPIYEYRCQECNKLFEVIASMSEATEAVACKHCGSARTKKTISAGSYRLSSASGGSAPSGALSGCSSRSGFS